MKELVKKVGERGQDNLIAGLFPRALTVVSRQAKGANLRHEVYHPESISDSICQGLRKWHSHP